MKPCIILGNGPSANELFMTTIVDTPIFGMNYAPIQPDFYICVDSDVLLNHADEIYPLAEGAQIAYLSAKHAGSSKLYDLPNVQLVDRDTQSFKSEQFLTGMTATYVALKMSYYMGFDEVHLYGVDHSLAWDHYRAGYPVGDADRRAWRMKLMFDHYALAAAVFARAGRRIINHSHASALDMLFARS